MHSFKFFPCKVLLLQKLLICLTIPLPYFSKKIIFPFSSFFSDFALPSAKGDTWGKRERPLTFQNMVQEVLLNDASRAKSLTRKCSFLTSKKIYFKNLSKTIILNNFKFYQLITAQTYKNQYSGHIFYA